MTDRAAITVDWLKAVGFRVKPMHDHDPAPHLVLFFGDAAGPRRAFVGSEDVGLEVSPTSVQRLASYDTDDQWHAWLRSDASHSRGRFCHIRYLEFQDDLIRVVEALSGVAWDPAWHEYGAIVPERMRSSRQPPRPTVCHSGCVTCADDGREEKGSRQ